METWEAAAIMCVIRVEAYTEDALNESTGKNHAKYQHAQLGKTVGEGRGGGEGIWGGEKEYPVRQCGACSAPLPFLLQKKNGVKRDTCVSFVLCHL